MSDYTFSLTYKINSQVSPEKLWPMLSDTNRLFKDFGENPVQLTNLSHSKKNGFKELTYEQVHRPDVWVEEPCQWEAPYYLSVRRSYKNGYFNYLHIAISILETDSGSQVSFRFTGEVKGITGWFIQKKKFNNRFKRQLKKIIACYDESVLKQTLPPRKKKPITLNNPVRWKTLQGQLERSSGNSKLTNKLIHMLQSADDEDLKNISPIKLASLWREPLHDVLIVLFYAAKLDILNFSWNVLCAHCLRAVQNCKSLNEVTDSLYCTECDRDFQVDFHRTVQLTFKPHPLLRKLPKKVYSIDGPALRAQVRLQALLQPEQKRFVKIELKEGNYRIYCDKTEGYVNATVKYGGLENATLLFSSNDMGVQDVVLSPNPNLILHNRSNEPILIKCENTDWENYSISASEVTSWSIFRDLFPRELIRNKKKLTANNLTILFTDLYNSSEIYNSNGDDSAIGLVMNHFDVLQRVIAEERGSIVKTIGDAVMAVFPKPLYAVKAFQRAQKIFKNELSTESSILLKGGIHTGDCVAVTLNNRIDYFGNTINIASRLVDYARGEDLVISNEAYSNSALEDYLSTRRKNLKIHHFDASLKGFENHTFEAKRITMQTSPLRLVV